MKVQIGDATLYLGSCEDILPTLGCSSLCAKGEPCSVAGKCAAQKIDAVITDPPFGVGFKYESHDDTPEGYIEWLWPILEQAEALCNPGAPVFVWQSGTNLRKASGWFPRDWRLFVAAKNFVQMRPTAMQWSFDPIICWWTPGAKPWTASTANRDFLMTNTAPVVSSPENIERGHPCPRPLDLLNHIVGQWVQPGGTMLDCFMGSGTAGVAAAQQGRAFIGIEKEPKYFDIACKRIEQAVSQGQLFTPAAPKAEQMGLLE